MPELTVFGELFWTVVLVLACGFPVFFLLCVVGGFLYEKLTPFRARHYLDGSDGSED